MAEYIKVSSDPKAKAITDGFRLISLTVKNSETGEKAWKSVDWGTDVFTAVKEAHLPARMLSFPAVGREIVFSTNEVIRDFRISQDIFVHGKQIEQWNYDFGFVMPGSENSWETIVQAAGEGKMLPAEFLSGNMYIVTNFYSGDLFIARNVVRIFYE
ncbi:GMP-PDE, delta subunit family protein [Tritrichomonas foetus]|uniref:GMP-PDE, delta subunit family protein n=1 Tax=Tritrichomonas foetus TaxID=1144522 RepID=A0A1J4J5B0_9EUKA|nr:GMP-PDE, delta subunit family protein [Tritrichomonas foetus]|eukprot:OHS93881.1 GMP-PDE, delta subunit family protein [Tritrichomonas foetus]